MVDFHNPIAIAADHAGYCMKEYIRERLSPEGYEFYDFGTFSQDSVDYPDFIHPLAKAVEDGKYDAGIIVCGSGNGVAIVANKYPDIRAAVCWNEEIAKLSRRHNNANVISLPARFISLQDSLQLVRIFFTTGFEGGRHEVRVAKINQLL
jgi:ribose 5-phosphate isomerase B